MAYDPERGGFLRLVVWLGVIGGLGYGGWLAYKYGFLGAQNATLEASLYSDLDSPGPSARLDCTVTFHKLPKGDPRDVQVVVSSPAMEGERVFDWAYIAEHDRSPETTPDSDPPLETPLFFRIQMLSDLKLQLTPATGDFIVRARLKWAGKNQDLARVSVKSLYHPK